jgi:RNA polymerase-associated protein CTR9
MQAESLFLLARVHHVRHEIDNAYKLYEKACKLAPEFAPARFGLAQTLVAQEDYTTAMKHLSILVQTSPMATDALALLGLLQVRSGQMNEGLLHIHKAMDLEPLNPDLITLEALALQREQPARALERYHKAVELLETTQQPVPYEIFCNIGVLCHETMQHPRALEYYTKALQVLPEASIKETKTFVKVLHPENCMFWNWIPAGQIQRPPAEGSNELVVESLLQDLEPGDHVRLGDTFISLVVQVNKKGASTTLVVKEAFLPPSAEAEPAEGSEEAPSQPMSVQFHVKRQNRLLENPKAITIAFNIARVHENAGNTVAAVQLHKAIVQRVPGYVNSYLRLACIARDNGCLKECSAWLKIACTAAPGNPEVLTLVGNLHLSLCDWAPAQNVFDQLLIKRVASVEAYSKLSMGNIYFANLDNPKTYAKNLKKAVDLYKSILGKDKANAYAANGIGAYLAERGEIFKAKEVFNRVREVSSDTIADAILNLGHIYLAQKKHPEALQMYNSYMKRTQDGTAPITTKNRQDDEAEVLLYIAFAYFDWARQAEALNNAQSAPADERYAMCTRHLELALQKSKRKEVLLFYNLCMTKLQAANCVLQKLTRNIRRTAQEVEDALKGLEKSLPKVEEILKWKNEGKKIPIHSSTLHDFITHCKANIDSAKSHLEEERKREQQAEQMRELQRSAAEAQKQEEELRKVMEQEEAAKLQEERDRKAAAKMKAVEQLRAGWEQEAENKKLEKERKAKGQKGTAVEDGGDLVPDEEEDQVDENAALFEETSDEEDEGQPTEKEGDYGTKADGVKEINPSREPESVINENELFGDSDEDEVDHEKEVDHADSGLAVSATAVDAKELFGDSDDDESDEELVSTEKKRAADEDDNVAPAKRQRLIDEEGEEES